MILTLDIETLCTTDPDAIASIRAGIKAPATHKKPETIAAWMAENQESATAEAVAKTSFDALYGSIACICFQFDDGDVHQVNAADGEEKMLRDFYFAVEQTSKVEYVGGTTSQPLVVCGHNVAGFDLPFLKQRSIILGVKPPPALLKAMNAKPWDGCIADTMTLWDSKKMVGMDSLCSVLGIPGKGDMDGSQVAEVWKTDPSKVIEYCRGDVNRTRQIYKRLTFNEDL